jgi:hypothetical protein
MGKLRTDVSRFFLLEGETAWSQERTRLTRVAWLGRNNSPRVTSDWESAALEIGTECNWVP